MKKIASVVFSLVLFAGVSFAARGDNQSSGYKAQPAKTQQKSYSSSSKKQSGKAECGHGSFGLGYSKTSTIQTRVGNADLDQIAVRYWINDDIAFDAQFGFDSGDNSATVLFGAKFIYNLVKLHKFNGYLHAGVAFGNYDPKQNGVNSMSLFRISGGLGAEYFLVPCFSLLTEMGIRYESASANGNNVSQFGTFADWLPQAGVRFYF